MAVVLTNNATSLLAAAIAAEDTTLSVTNSDAGKYPNPGAGQWFPLTIVDNAGNMEIVKATARNGAIITIERAQEGTTAKAFAAGARVDLRATIGALNDIGAKTVAESEIRTSAPSDEDFIVGVGAGSASVFKMAVSVFKSALTTIFYDKTEINNIVKGTMDGRAYPRRVGGGALNFNWSGKSGNPTWLWGFKTGDGVEGQDMFVYSPGQLSVNYASSAGNANSVGGQTQAQIWAQIENRAAAFANDRKNACVTDTRFAGYVEGISGGQSVEWWSPPSGYVATAHRKSSSSTYVSNIAYRQPQIYIANIGWRAFGGW